MKAISMRTTLLAAAGIGLLTSAFFAGKAIAAGIPETGALTYAGKLQDAEGAPLAGTRNVEVRFWSASTAGTSLCSSGEVEVTLSAGNFAVPLPDDCTDAVSNNPNLWVEVVVDSVSLGRAKAGAVPYAVEANHAVSAASAVEAEHAVEADSAVNVAVSVDGSGQRICTGSTPAGSTAWQVYSTSYLTLSIDTSECGFTATPRYFTSLGGSTHHWRTAGATSIYAATTSSFQIYLFNEGGNTVAAANTDQWHINWMAVGE